MAMSLVTWVWCHLDTPMSRYATLTVQNEICRKLLFNNWSILWNIKILSITFCEEWNWWKRLGGVWKSGFATICEKNGRRKWLWVRVRVETCPSPNNAMMSSAYQPDYYWSPYWSLITFRVAGCSSETIWNCEMWQYFDSIFIIVNSFDRIFGINQKNWSAQNNMILKDQPTLKHPTALGQALTGWLTR